MFSKIICVVLFSSSVISRNVPNYKDLDEDDQMLFRAAYDSYDNVAYNHESSYNPDISYNNYDNEIPMGKLDLLKDGMWALKAKMKELKAFNKALAANLLLTKIQVKDLIENHMKPLKKHIHKEVDKKPVYHQPPPSYSQYEQLHPHYTASGPQYSAPAPQYVAPAPQYAAPAPQYVAPAPQYAAPAPQYTAQHYGGSAGAQQSQPIHDPYYGQ